MDSNIYNKSWFLYIAECKGGTLYVGIAIDVTKRIKEHNNTSKCRYTRFRKPVKLVYSEFCESYSIARKRELEVKRFSRQKKLELAGKDLSIV